MLERKAANDPYVEVETHVDRGATAAPQTQSPSGEVQPAVVEESAAAAEQPSSPEETLSEEEQPEPLKAAEGNVLIMLRSRGMTYDHNGRIFTKGEPTEVTIDEWENDLQYVRDPNGNQRFTQVQTD